MKTDVFLDFKVQSSPEDGFNLTLVLDCSSVPKLAEGNDD